MDPFFNLPNLAYWLVIIITVTVTTATLGKRWKRQENARWTVGWFIPFFWGFWMVLFGYFDANTWLALFFAVGFCGVVKVGFELYTKAKLAETIRGRDGRAD